MLHTTSSFFAAMERFYDPQIKENRKIYENKKIFFDIIYVTNCSGAEVDDLRKHQRASIYMSPTVAERKLMTCASIPAHSPEGGRCNEE